MWSLWDSSFFYVTQNNFVLYFEFWFFATMLVINWSIENRFCIKASWETYEKYKKRNWLNEMKERNGVWATCMIIPANPREIKSYSSICPTLYEKCFLMIPNREREWLIRLFLDCQLTRITCISNHTHDIILFHKKSRVVSSPSRNVTTNYIRISPFVVSNDCRVLLYRLRSLFFISWPNKSSESIQIWTVNRLNGTE